MPEIALAAAVALVLAATTAGEGTVHALFVGGAAVAALGLAAAVPAGVAYHIALFRALVAAGAVPPRWWWHPTRLHERLAAERQRTVLGWFRAGAAGFALALAGCALVLAAVLAQ